MGSGLLYLPSSIKADGHPLPFLRWPNHYLRKMLTVTDANRSVFWWGINVAKVENSAPGKQEQDGIGNIWAHQRDRHVRIDTGILETIFNRIVGVGGDAERYKKVASDWRHYVSTATYTHLKFDLGSPLNIWMTF